MKKKIFCLLAFVGLGSILLYIPFTDIVGSGQKFSLFDFFAPSAGAFLASGWGAVSVIFVKLINALATGQSLEAATIIRFFPLALAAVYFGAGKKQKLAAIIPLICVALFIWHPEGRGAWYYSLYWLIPLVAAALPKSLIFRSLGATFTAHAVGSVGFLYAFNLPSEVWIALIPVVFLERMLFTGGIALSYIAFNTLVSRVADKFSFDWLSRLTRPEYTFSKKILSNL